MASFICFQFLSMGVDASAAETDVFGPFSGPAGVYAVEERDLCSMAYEAALTASDDDCGGLDVEEVYCGSIRTLLQEHGRDSTAQFHVCMRQPHGKSELATLGEVARAIKILDLSALDDWDGSAASLSQFSNMRELILAGTAQCDEHLQALHPLQSLRVLDLSDTRVTDAGMQHVASMRGLYSLILTGTQVTPEKEQWLQSQLPECEIINDRY